MTTQKGFTLIELILTIAIFDVLVGIVEKLYTDCLNNVQYHQDQDREIVDACNQIK